MPTLGEMLALLAETPQSLENARQMGKQSIANAIFSGAAGRAIPRQDWRTVVLDPENPPPASGYPRSMWAPIVELERLLERTPNLDYKKSGEQGTGSLSRENITAEEVGRFIPPQPFSPDRQRFQELLKILSVPNAESFGSILERYRNRPKKEPVPDTFPPIG